MPLNDGYDMPVFLELFLTPSEKDNFAVWKEIIIDRSVVNRVCSPIFDWIAGHVPDTVAPNVLTLSGAFAVLQAWYFCEIYAEKSPRLVAAVSVVSICIFWAFGGIDGKHAQRIMNDTSLGELFKYVCDMISAVFLVIVMCLLILEPDPDRIDTEWYLVQTVQLILLLKHHSAFQREAGLRYFLVGPGELITWAMGALAWRAVFGLQVFYVLYEISWGVLSKQLVKLFELQPDGFFATMTPARAIYTTVFVFTFAKIALANFFPGQKSAWTRNALLVILTLRAGSGFLRMDQMAMATGSTRRDVIFDGLFMAMVTSDLIVAKMAGRGIHTWVVLMATMVVMPHLQFLILCFVIFYYIAIFGDLMNHMNLPLLQVCRNVYCDGVYDLCHVGHKNLFRKALKLGNRLLVGVVGDEDANNYKRPPVMTASEREEEVKSCKCVTKVIANAPCFGLTEEFIKRHRIHVVCFGQEYLDRYPDPKDDPYYKVPRQMNIARPMPRTEGLSTSDLIKRIQQRGLDEKKSPT